MTLHPIYITFKNVNQMRCHLIFANKT